MGNPRYGGATDACMSVRGAVAITGAAQTFGDRGVGAGITVTADGDITFVTMDGDTVTLTLTARGDPYAYTVKSITSATLSGYVDF